MNNSFFRNKKIILPLVALVLLLAVFLVVEYVVPKSSENETASDAGELAADSGSQDQTPKSIGVEALYDSNPQFVQSGLSHHETISLIEGRVDGKPYSLKKSDGQWISSDNVKISNSSVLRLAVNLCSVRYTDTIPAKDADYEASGIGEGSDYIRFENTYGISVEYVLGNSIPDTDLYYVKTSLNEDVYMVDESTITTIFQPFENYRSDKLSIVDFENIEKIHLKNSNTEFTLEKGEPDRNKGIYYEWKMTFPYSIFARDDMVKELLIAPGGMLEAKEYVSDSGDFENYGLASKENMIIYEDAVGKGQTIYFSELINNNYYICIDDAPNIYQVGSEDLPFASVSTIDVADRSLYLVNRSALKQVVISGAERNYTVEFNEDSSVNVNGNKITDSSKTSEIFQNVCGLRGDDMIESVSGESALKMTFEKNDGTSVMLEFYARGERYYDVTRDGVPLYTIQKNTVERLFDFLDTQATA